jgi:hypothetical protein
MHEYSFTPVSKNDYYHESISMTYAMMFTASANFLLSSGKTEEAKEYLRLALKAKPNFQQALELKRKHNL